MANLSNIRQDADFYNDVPLVREFKKPSGLIVFGPAAGFALYGLTAVGMIAFDILVKLF
ncbi:hypothetical protein [Lysinibacillus odysseyi]|uniref:hypothetical protein n=1 Tax=Lysinibacillus odysseyi TaxID=202611 RepID=UPI000A4A0B9B|nr:hypothetical protein [Lysinibacillus odysseyi]